MLSTKEMQQVLDDVSYRPSWSFSLFEDEYEGPYIRILATLINSYDPSTTTDVGINSPLPPFETKEQFLKWLAWRLRRIEIHESQEWFKVNGKVVSDPHMGEFNADR